MNKLIRWFLTLLVSMTGVVAPQTAYCDRRGGETCLDPHVLWRYRAPGGGCEIAACSSATQKLFVTVGGVDVVSMRSGARLGGIPAIGGYHATSVACAQDIVAVAWAADDKRRKGRIAVYEAHSLSQLAAYEAGYLPDMIVFTPDGKNLLAANEGEPAADYSFDPEASISIITPTNGWKDSKVREATFTRFDAERAQLLAAGLHLCGPNTGDPPRLATVAQDLEPEYIAVSGNSKTAWITLQENNAIAQLDIEAGKITAIHPLGLKSFRSLGGGNRLASFSQSTGLDGNDTDGPRIRHWPVWGMYQPDGIAAFVQDGHDYLVTANEGDPRDYIGFQEVVRIRDLAAANITVDASNPARRLAGEEQLGRLLVSRCAGDTDRDGDLDRFIIPGTRSFAVWRVVGDSLELIFDSGSDFERIVAHVMPERYNADSLAESPSDIRSPTRGPEPENVAIVEVQGRRVVAIGLERTGGAMLYDISRPHEPAFLDYLPPHEAGGVLDLAPEGLLAVSAEQGPTGEPLLILCNEGSGTVTAWEIGSHE